MLKKYFKEGFDKVAISIASDEDIKNSSYGEVTKPETINYRTMKPEKGGLFCAKIFGPIKDYECSCGKYKRFRYKGIVCEKCGVEVTTSRVRRTRMGHIKLVCPVAHIWFAKSVPSKFSLALDLSSKKVDSVLYFEKYIVIDPGTTVFEKNQLISPEEYENAIKDCSETGDIFEAGIGPAAIRTMLSQIDLEKEIKNLKEKMNSDLGKVDVNKRKYIKRYKLLEGFQKSGNKPEWMIIKNLPVIAPDLRPLVPLEGGRFAVSDLNDLYRRVINRNNRLKKLIELSAPNIILHNEMRMLQESVFSLFDNSRKDRPVMGMNKRPLKSLSEAFRGKASRFRQHLLGKRVDYSARSVICVGPKLKLDECGIPRLMALELFRPFIFAGLQKKGYAQSLHAAKKMVDNHSQYAYDVLEEVVKDHCVVLNRAPTLHRQSIQAFKPILTNDKAIHLHPLVCEIFNADFDGDQMAVHLPLSVEAQAEAKSLMLSSLNIRNPSNGEYTIIPKEDILVGLYYLTYKFEEKYTKIVFSSENEAWAAYKSGKIKIQTEIQCFIEENDRNKIYTTTAGRCFFYKEIKETGVSFEMCNITLSSSTLKVFFDNIGDSLDDEKIVFVADKLKDLGFEYSTTSGVSFGKDDMIIPSNKSEVVSEAQKQSEVYMKQYKSGVLSDSERYYKVINTWSSSIDKILNQLIKEISAVENGFDNDMYLIQVSGARGSKEQMRQLCAIKGIMYNSEGKIVETPIINSFIESLSVTEYFFSTAGGRKSLADTAIKTADAGYLTRRLVDVVEDTCITSQDCGTSDSIEKKYIRDGEEIILSLRNAIHGRYSAEDIVIDGNLICPKNGYIDKKTADAVGASHLESIKVRSPLTCALPDGNVCVKCYGLDLSKSKIVNLNESVGIIAAHSISEPSTQLTMRSFHGGGAAKTSLDDSRIHIDRDCNVKLVNLRAVESNGKRMIVSYSTECYLYDEHESEIARYKIPYGAELLVPYESFEAKKGDTIVVWDGYVKPIVCEHTGKIEFRDLIPGISLEEKIDELTGVSVISVPNWKQNMRAEKLKPRIIVKSKDDEVEYHLKPYSTILINEKDKVKPGDVLAKEPKPIESAKDIIGGLTRVSDLFEMKKQKSIAVMVKEDGVVNFASESKNSWTINVIKKNGEYDEYTISKTKNIIVYDGNNVKKGDLLTNGEECMQDILSILGLEAVANYLINEIQGIYRAQGITVNDKHFEIVIKQMLSSVEIIDEGDSDCLSGDIISISDFDKKVEQLKSAGKKPPTSMRVIEGITKISLENKSFISAAAFRDATRILTTAAINGSIDDLDTKKSAAIVGILMKAGTGKLPRDLIARKNEILRELKGQVL